MTTALNQTLIDKGITDLCKDGGWRFIKTALTNGTGIFIGAAVCRRGETAPDIDLCAEDEAIWGFVLGYSNRETIDNEGYFYRDYDVPFANNKYVNVGVPRPEGVYLVLSGTNKQIAKEAPIQCVDGVFQQATTDQSYQMISEELVGKVANTRKYFYARWVKPL